MYEDFFGLQHRPFSSVPNADDFVGVAPLQDALDSLVHCITQARGIAIVTSATGMGKTMLCKRLAKLLQQNYRSIFLSAAGMESRLSLLQGILFELNMGYVGLTDQEARLKFLQAAREAKSDRRGFLLIVDESHLLPPRLLDELRALTEYAPDGENLVQVVLCGSFELEEKLADPAMMSFNQRIGLQICLTPLSLNDSARLISERFKACGAPNVLSIMDEEALELICRASDGNLRCLTQLTDHACLLAFADARQPIDRQIVRSALENLKELPLRWNDIPGEAAEQATADDFWDDDLTELAAEVQAVPLTPPPKRISPTDQETDEFLIPEFLRLDDGSIASTQDLLDVDPEEIETPALPIEMSHQFTNFEHVNTETPEYAVFEVGAGTESARMDEELEARSEEGIMESPVTYSMNSVLPPGMIEIPVIDRYTLLDRLLELPEDRQDTIDLSSLESDVDAPVTLPMGEPPLSTPVSISEEDVLELVQQIRRNVQEHMNPQQHAGHAIPGPHQQLSEDEIPDRAFYTREISDTPEMNSESAEPRRFEQLFTRLRLRRKKVEAERQTH